MMALGLLLIFTHPIADLTESIAPGTMKWLLLLQGGTGTLIQNIIGYLLLGFAFITLLNSRLLNHRGLTHTLLCWLILSGATLATYHAIESPHVWLFTACFSLGYLLHLVADATTEEGLPDLLFPMNGDNPNDVLPPEIGLKTLIVLMLSGRNRKLILKPLTSQALEALGYVVLERLYQRANK